jgi:hypothetical protein
MFSEKSFPRMKTAVNSKNPEARNRTVLMECVYQVKDGVRRLMREQQAYLASP